MTTESRGNSRKVQKNVVYDAIKLCFGLMSILIMSICHITYEVLFSLVIRGLKGSGQISKNN